MFQISPMFAVPFAFDRHPEPARLNSQLRDLFLAREGEGQTYANPHPSTPRNRELFESHFDLFSWQDPPIRELREFCLTAVMRTACALNQYDQAMARSLQIQTDAWFHVTRRNGFFGMHNHPNASWSAVYCVSPGRSDAGQSQSGALSFMNPINNFMMHVDPGVERMLQPPFGWGNYSFLLEAGQLVIFPSWVVHQVLPFFGEGERITVAMNCSFRHKHD